jgi:hypothetical protein
MCAAAVSFAVKPTKAPRAAMAVTKATYQILHQGKEKGREDVVRTDYNDNTIEFDVDYVFSPVDGSTMKNECKLVVREDSFFPIEYDQERTVSQQGDELNTHSHIEMVANVAVRTSGTETVKNTRNIVVPTGAAILETGSAYTYEPFLYWYDHDLGGRQTFDVLDANTGRPSTVVMHFVDQDTVTVADTEYVADVFELERDNFDVKLYVDELGRLVRVDQNYMLFDLVSWSREGGE